MLGSLRRIDWLTFAGFLIVAAVAGAAVLAAFEDEITAAARSTGRRSYAPRDLLRSWIVTRTANQRLLNYAIGSLARHSPHDE
jgi:hypothetical protein